MSSASDRPSVRGSQAFRHYDAGYSRLGCWGSPVFPSRAYSRNIVGPHNIIMLSGKLVCNTVQSALV